MPLINEEDLTISAEQIAKDGLNQLDKKYQKSVGFFAWNYFVATGKIIYKVWEKVLYIVNCLTDLSNMEYDDLVKFCYNTRGIEAKTETASSGYLQVTNGTGTITAGDIFETATGIQFKALTTKTVVTNEKFEVECLTKGSVGNVAAYSIVVIPTTIQGIVSVTNPEEFTNGYDNETKEALLERYYIDLRTPAACGNKYHYQKWALEVEGVGKVKVKPLWNGNNTVKVVILDSNYKIATPELIKEVQNYIDPYTLDEEGNKIGWVQIIGTLLFGGSLLKWILPLVINMFATIENSNKINELCITLGGKIHRKWFLLNNLIYLISLILLTLLLFIFKNWVMFIIVIPYLILIYVLYWGNIYKRINAITNNSSFSKFFTIFMAIFVLSLKYVYKLLPDSTNLIIEILLTIFWFLIFVLPTKKYKDENVL